MEQQKPALVGILAIVLVGILAISFSSRANVAGEATQIPIPPTAEPPPAEPMSVAQTSATPEILGTAMMGSEAQPQRTPNGIRFTNRFQKLSAAYTDRFTITRGGGSIFLRTAALQRGTTIRTVSSQSYDIQDQNVISVVPWGTEWHRNTPAGIKQGFTIVEQLSGTGPLILTMETDAQVTRAAPDTLILSDGKQTTFQYSGLVVIDAMGTSLPAQMEISPHRISIVIDDAAAVYPVEVDPIIALPVWIADSHQNNFKLGWALAGAGDVNGDGYGDILAAATAGESSLPNRVFLWYGESGGLGIPGAPENADWGTTDIMPASEYSKGSVASAGDVNGDGFDDILVVTESGSTPTSVGTAYLWYGGPNGPANGQPGTMANADWVAEIDSGFFWYSGGISAFPAAHGDVNGDGYDDIVLSAYLLSSLPEPPRTTPHYYHGGVFAWYGSPNGPANGAPGSIANANWKIYGDHQVECGASHAGGGEMQLGIQLSVGDVNADSYDDLDVASWGGFDGYCGMYPHFVWYGSAIGLPADLGSGWASVGSAQWQTDPRNVPSGLGGGIVGDIDGDGDGEFAAGRYGWEGDPTGLGPVGTVGNADWVIQISPERVGLPTGTAFSVTQYRIADIDNDGYDDLFGRATYTSGVDVAQYIFGLVWKGVAVGFTVLDHGNADFMITAQQPWQFSLLSQGNSYFAWKTSFADVDGDGAAEIFTSDPHFDDAPLVDAGRLYVYDLYDGPTTDCGNYVIDAGEECDDGNPDAYDGCDRCQLCGSFGQQCCGASGGAYGENRCNGGRLFCTGGSEGTGGICICPTGAEWNPTTAECECPPGTVYRDPPGCYPDTRGTEDPLPGIDG